MVVGIDKYDNLNILELLKSEGYSQAKKNKRQHRSMIKKILKLQKSGSFNQEAIVQSWNKMALDFFIENSHKKRLMWSDIKSVDILNFWKDIDNNIAFVLVYNSPEKLFSRMIKKDRYSTKMLHQLMTYWIEYNTKLLQFFYKNQDRTFLIHGEVAEKALKNNKKHIINIADTNTRNEDLLQEYLLQQVFCKNVAIQDLYVELQSVANVYQSKEEVEPEIVLQHFMSLKEQHNAKMIFANKKIEALQEQKKEIELDRSLLEKKVKKLSKKAIKLQKDTVKSLQKEKALLQEELEKVKNQKKSETKEKEQLLTQLTNVQEELENYYNELKEKTNFIEKIKQDNSAITEKLNKANSELEKVKNQKKSEIEEKEQLLAQLMNVQEELEKYYLENQKLKQKIEEKKKYYGAAERIKQQLSYRLGAKMIENSKSFWGIVTLPFALLVVRSQYKKDMKNRAEKLPPIKTYADAYDAERVKKHLSYRLGQTTIRTLKNPFGLFVLPFKLQATYKAFKEDRK